MSIAGANAVAYSSWGLLATAEVSGGWDGSTTATSPAAMVAEILDAKGVGTEGTDLFYGFQPDSPDECIACFEGAGRDANPKWALDFPGVTVIVRSDRGDYDGGWTLAQGVKDTLLGIDPGATVRGITMRGDIIALGPDENERFEWSLNFALTVEPATSGNRTAI
ncbi:MAG TPA: minor capsid protein [Candidatus Sumerlaeota bacterium]|nr:minor capsid protein [Candidatus Sumerlaeota bacterium]